MSPAVRPFFSYRNVDTTSLTCATVLISACCAREGETGTGDSESRLGRTGKWSFILSRPEVQPTEAAFHGWPAQHTQPPSYSPCRFEVLAWKDFGDHYYYYWSLLYSAILRSRADSLRSHVILHEWIAFYSAFLNIHRSGVLTALAWLVPQESAAISARSVYTIQPCTVSLHAKPHT